jgi:hypothetical protein
MFPKKNILDNINQLALLKSFIMDVLGQQNREDVSGERLLELLQKQLLKLKPMKKMLNKLLNMKTGIKQTIQPLTLKRVM